MDMTQHPTQADFDRLANGDVPPAEFERFVAHFDVCPACARRFDERCDADGTLLATVRRSLLDRDSLLDETGCRTLTTWLDQGLSAESDRRAALNEGLPAEIGDYTLDRMIGCGGMGVVFKAHDTELSRPVAVKLLAPYLASSGSARNRFAREARAAAAVVDDHVVPIHNVETDDEHPFLVMKYIAGGSLQQRLDREGPLEVCEVDDELLADLD